METANNDITVLVTGGSGFVGGHCILQLLQNGYRVKTTLRSLSKKNKVLASLKTGGLTNFDNLQFIEADLGDDKNWAEAVTGCTYVLHVASPIFLRLPKNEDEMIRPAVDGTIRVLKAARDAGVKRVVVTSSFGAVGYSHTDPNTLITEEEWTNPNDKTLSAYLKSKTLAERAAWDFMAREGSELELAVINPMAILGTSLGPDMSSGFELLKKILDGSMKGTPKIELGIVDVRDLAELHLLAMVNPAAAGERFLALSGGVMSLHQIAMLFREKFGDRAKQVTHKELPDWQIRLAALFSKQAKTIVPLLGRTRNASNAKAKTLLGWRPRSNEEAVLATAESLFKYNMIKDE
ncbi:SDR family oxidoreductase [Mucilaginibacter pedocola]|uniref:3-beta hydroxysteroid dehydrogenase n=1 Tax=Mucilaginibacter pedocola TaxID=1792845 RepID=A0A1S9PCM3_9SPHI|nr:aldehyde reductase [Mucilaginibacter pedocola]OOQ58723.1 3-beta hydroxysteroid dehydrogenase [Mucilaginibacter pedocola]